MCGIAGMIGLDSRESIIDAMLKTMIHRGPDGEGIYQRKDCTLLHRRLAVIDPVGGAQPMSILYGEERYVLVYNGELYNTEEIRRDLIREGHEFTGHSDTEVVLHAYIQWKEGCLERFNGIFAFAVWEEKKEQLFLARDRIGVKPFFYSICGNGFIFGSEIKTILAHPAVKPVLDEEGACQVMMLGPGRLPGSGVFRNIRELEPGCWGRIRQGKLRMFRYWKLRDREHRDSFGETVETVRELVVDAVRRQMVSDVPIGTFLSGGLDSSLITSVISNQMKQEGRQLKTFSVDYEDHEKHFVPGKFQPDSDTKYIRLMQQHLGTDHFWSVLTTEDMLDSLEDATYARDLPGMADVDVSLLAFCRQIKSQVTVALSGECADEIFGGYPWYRDPEIRSADGFPWAQNTAFRGALMSKQLRSRVDGEAFVRDCYRATCDESDILPDTQEEERRMKEMVNMNFRWFMQTLLDRKDRMSMYTGLEVRVPFCDYRIAEYLYSVPWKFKNHLNVEKGLLRSAMEGILPHEILWRKKSPYPKTMDPRYRELVADRLRQIINQPDQPIWQMVDRDQAQLLLESEQSWPWYGQLMKGPQTMAYLLQINIWLRKYRIDFSF